MKPPVRVGMHSVLSPHQAGSQGSAPAAGGGQQQPQPVPVMSNLIIAMALQNNFTAMTSTQ